MGKKRTGNRRGRPTIANDFHLVIVPRKATDLRRLGGALVALSLLRARDHDVRGTAAKDVTDGSA